MALKAVGFHPEAAEAEAAIAWYQQRSTKAAAEFLREIENAIEAIAENPERWPVFGPGSCVRDLRRGFPASSRPSREESQPVSKTSRAPRSRRDGEFTY